MAAGKSTINTVLKWGASASALTKVTKIKSYPQLWGAPEQLETTDLEDTSQTFVMGVQSVDQMEFTLNYDYTTLTTIKADENKDLVFELDFGTDGADGKFHWNGQLAIYVNEGEVNGLREMTLVVTPSSVIATGAAAS